MQKKHVMEIIAGLLVLFATAGTIVGALVYEKKLSEDIRTIEITALAPEKGNWNLQEINLVAGEPVRLKIRNIDTVSHGFVIPELGIGITATDGSGTAEIKPGQVATIEFTPEKRGNFLFMCTAWCSTRHLQMAGRIIVTQK